MFGKAKTVVLSQRGQNLVEFAVVLLLLFVILGGTMDLGRAFYTYIGISNGARAGARYGARLPCLSSSTGQPAQLSAAIEKAVTDEAATSGVDPAALEITLSPDPEIDGCGSWEMRDGSPLQVTVSSPFQAGMGGATGLLGFTGLGNFNLTVRASAANFGNDAQ